MTKKQIEGKWKRFESALIPYTDTPDRTVSYVKELYTLYDGSCLGWLGGLFDSDIGGFYFSNSARDSDEFFPDIESTGQAIGLLECSGAITSYNDIPEWMRSRIACFICACEDPETGFFYNPQWSKELTDARPARRARDSRWAHDLAEMCHFEIKHPSFFRTGGGGDKIPPHLRSREAFLAELSGMDWKNNTYGNMHVFASQFDQIAAVGLSDVAIDFLDSLQDPTTGLWGEGNLDDVKKMKTLGGVFELYRTMNALPKEPSKIADFVFSCFDNDYSNDISFIVSRWSVLKHMVKLFANYGGAEEIRVARSLIQRIVDNSEHMISKTYDTLALFKRGDGSFSYSKDGMGSMSQKMTVAKGDVIEGNINATILAASVPSKILKAITLSDDIPPIFSADDLNNFCSAAKGKKLAQKVDSH